MGYSIWTLFPAVAELFLSSDICFSTGGAAGMSFCNFALGVTIYFCSYHALVGSLFKHNLSVLENRIIGPNVGSFNVAWIWTCFCMAICTPLTAGHFMEVNLKQYLFWAVSFLFLQAFLQVCREFQRALVGQTLHYWFITSVNGRIVHAMQSSNVFPSWSQARQQLETRCTTWRPTYSRILSILSLHRSSYEWRAIGCSVLWLSGLGFSLKGRRLSRSVSEKLWVILRCKFGKISADVAEFFRQPFPYLVCIRQIGGQIFLPGLWFLQVLPLRTETIGMVRLLTMLAHFILRHSSVSGWSRLGVLFHRQCKRMPLAWK